MAPFCRNEPFTSNVHSSFKLVKAEVGEGLKTLSVTAAGEVAPALPETGRPVDEWNEAGAAGREAGDASVMMGNREIGRASCRERVCYAV